jgi:predicted nucleic acid-binding protein
MRVVVADTGPHNYLVQIDAIELLPKLFGQILVPAAVHDELSHLRSPASVRAWIAAPPPWLEIRPNPGDSTDRVMSRLLDQGERATIALAGAIGADLILMDERDGVAIARSHGFAVTGTLGVLDLALQRELVNLAQAVTRLKATSFHYRQGLLDALLAQRSEEKK